LPANNGKPDNLATAMTEVSERVSVLVREEIELAKAEVTGKVSSLARGAAAIAVAAVFGLLAVPFGLLTLAWGLNEAIGSQWLGFVIVFGLLLILTVSAGMFAWRKFRVGAPTPKMAIDEAKKIRETVAVKAGNGS
jgi:membrane protein YdbS with pleckstrin-like domain